MQIGNELYFAPDFSFLRLGNFSNEPEVLEAFKARVEHWYLMPAERLVERGDAFACGLICCATIDFLSRYAYSEPYDSERIPKWLSDNVPEEFKQADKSGKTHCSKRAPTPKPYATLAERFYYEFRNGLVHEGRIKSLGQFSLEPKYQDKIVDFVDHEKHQAMVINPQQLLKAIRAAFDVYCQQLESVRETRTDLLKQLQEDFKEEIEADKEKRLTEQARTPSPN